MARKLTFRGKTLSLAEWSRETGIPVTTIASRVGKLGLSVEEALTRPVAIKHRPEPADLVVVRPVPKLRRDKQGRAFCRWMDCGVRRRKIFGPANDPATKQSYSRWAAEWMAAQAMPPPPEGEILSVAGLCIRVIQWADSRYVKHGKRTSTAYQFRSALAPVNELYGETPAVDFGPAQLRAVRAKWVAAKLSLNTCNAYQDVVCRAWSWAAAQPLLPVSVVQALERVEHLVAGQTAATNPEPVLSAPAEHLDAILPHLHAEPDRQAILLAVVQLLRHSGMRPGEVLELRACDVIRSTTPWEYKPASGGKTLHRGKPRKVFLGPQARAVLEPWLARRREDELLFGLPRRRGEGDDVPLRIEFLRQCLAAACRTAGVPVIRPNQIRHTRATELDELGESSEAIAASLGNSREVVERVYIDSHGAREAKRIAEQHG